jgi:hypothetical protein
LADQQYDVRGEDLYRIGSEAIPSRVSYLGTQMLVVNRDGKHVRYAVQANYTRDSDGVKEHTSAQFVQELLPSGTFEDRLDQDPDFLTVLNQPFAVRLDPPTLRDLRTLHAPVPFDATSPLGGTAVLRGFLRPAIGGKIHGRQTVAVTFEANGPMSAPMPAKSGATISGHMRMDGTAYYALDDAMLLGLDVTLTILAHLHDSGRVEPVRIVYRRSMRAVAEQPATPIRTPKPTALPSGDETAPPAAR